jgi:hypothetical protein
VNGEVSRANGEASRVNGEVSREAAKECSPRRKPWVKSKT